jgi:hypothetical protein
VDCQPSNLVVAFQIRYLTMLEVALLHAKAAYSCFDWVPHCFLGHQLVVHLVVLDAATLQHQGSLVQARMELELPASLVIQRHQ